MSSAGTLANLESYLKKLGKWRLIVDMSHPEGSSVNDGVKKSWYSLSYATVTDAAHGITAYGKAATLILLSKMHTECPGSPRGQAADGDAVGGIVVRRHSLPIRLTFSTQDIHCFGRCS